MIRAIRPNGLVAEQRKRLAHDLLADVRLFDRQLGELDKRLDAALLEHGSTLTEMGGVAPIEIVSGEHMYHRLSRSGNRQLNCAIHLIALQQFRHNREGGDVYYCRKIADVNDS